MLRWLAEQGVNLLARTTGRLAPGEIRRLAGTTAALLAAQDFGRGRRRRDLFKTLRCIVEHAGVEALRTADDSVLAGGGGGMTCAHYAAQMGQLPMLQWIVEEAGVETLRVVDGNGATPVMRAAQGHRFRPTAHHLDVIKWIVSQLGLECLSVTANSGQTVVSYECGCGHLAAVEYIFDVLGGEALRVGDRRGDTPLQVLENREGSHRAQPALQAHLHRLLAISEEQPALISAHMRLALAKAIHSKLGAGSPLAEPVEQELVQTIGCESGLPERETNALAPGAAADSHPHG